MGKGSFSIKKKDKNVIPMALDANFYFERALRHLDRNDYTKALKYLWRTIDIEPNNATHYCNLAAILSEIGNFKESNDLLFYVIEKLDPKLTECYYYIANNFAHLEEFEMAFNYINRYLDIDPNGEYAEEALDMLSFISVEIDDMDNIDDEQRELYMLHYKAKNLLEEGKFIEASKRLKKMLAEHPDFHPARNNLALAYFYLGNYTSAIEQARIVLEEDRSNIHALCNLAIFYQHLNYKEEYDFLVNFLKKVEPFDKEHFYKLATSFAILGEHEMAFLYFKKLIKKEELNPILLHYGAVSAFNTNNIELAFKWWEKVLKFDENSEIVRFYLDICRNFDNGKQLLPIFSYQYELPFEQLTNLLMLEPKLYKNDFTFFALRWGLENINTKIKDQIILSFSYFKNKESEKVLRDYLVANSDDIYYKKKALLALQEIGAVPPYKVSINGETHDIEKQDPDMSTWRTNWLDVLALLEMQMREDYTITELFDSKTMWFDFISKSYPNTPQIRKIEGWAASIEYLVAKMHHKHISLEKIASKYAVSKQTVSKHIEEIKELLEINTKFKDYSIYNNNF